MLISFPKIVGCSESVINRNGYIEQAVFYDDYPFIVEPTKIIGKHLSMYKDVVDHFDFYYKLLVRNIQQCDYLRESFNMAGYRRIGILVPINHDRGVLFHYCIDDSKGHNWKPDTPNKKTTIWPPTFLR